jgi:hypothetical protein
VAAGWQNDSLGPFPHRCTEGLLRLEERGLSLADQNVGIVSLSSWLCFTKRCAASRTACALSRTSEGSVAQPEGGRGRSRYEDT